MGGSNISKSYETKVKLTCNKAEIMVSKLQIIFHPAQIQGNFKPADYYIQKLFLIKTKLEKFATDCQRDAELHKLVSMTQGRVNDFIQSNDQINQAHERVLRRDREEWFEEKQEKEESFKKETVLVKKKSVRGEVLKITVGKLNDQGIQQEKTQSALIIIPQSDKAQQQKFSTSLNEKKRSSSPEKDQMQKLPTPSKQKQSQIPKYPKEEKHDKLIKEQSKEEPQKEKQQEKQQEKQHNDREKQQQEKQQLDPPQQQQQQQNLTQQDQQVIDPVEAQEHEQQKIEFKVLEPLPPQKTEQEIEDDLCKICLENKKTHAAVPCGHFIYCSKCKIEVMKKKKCFLCKSKVTSFMKVFQ